MLLTEQKAKERWCPFVRFTEGCDDAAANRWEETVNPERCRCIASQCMAWRWFDGEFTNEPEHVRRPLTDQRRGYCGLAGEP